MNNDDDKGPYTITAGIVHDSNGKTVGWADADIEGPGGKMNNDMPCYRFTVSESAGVTLVGQHKFLFVLDDRLDVRGFFCPPENLPLGKWELRFVPNEKSVIAHADLAPGFRWDIADAFREDLGDDYQRDTWVFAGADERCMMEARLVKGDGVIVGVEFQVNDAVYFASFRQDLWPGLRVGKFPCRSDGAEWGRETVKVFGEKREGEEGLAVAFAEFAPEVTQDMMNTLEAQMGDVLAAFRAWSEDEDG